MLARVLKNNGKKRDRKRKIPTRVGITDTAPIDEVAPYQSQAQTRKKGCKKDKQERVAELNLKWNQTKALMASKAQDLTTKKQIIRGIAETCTELLHVREGRVENVAAGIGGTLVPPPLSVDQLKRYFGDVKAFPEIDELIDITNNGVPVNSTVTNLYPTRALQRSNHIGVRKHMDLVWEKLFHDSRRNRVLVLTENQRRRSRAYVWNPLAQLLHTNKELSTTTLLTYK